MRDPFDISQYRTSLLKESVYTPDAFAFAHFQDAFAFVSENIKMRQAAVRIGFEVPEDSFINVESYTLTTPDNLSDTIDLFQDAMRQLVQGSLIETYGKLPGCDIYTGFYHFSSNGLPIVGIGSIMTEGDFSAPPDLSVISNIIEFAAAIGVCLNEILFAMNSMRYFHGLMKFSYPFDDNCGVGASSAGSPGPDPGGSTGGGTSVGSTGGGTSGAGGTSAAGSGGGSSPGGSSPSVDPLPGGGAEE